MEVDEIDMKTRNLHAIGNAALASYTLGHDANQSGLAFPALTPSLAPHPLPNPNPTLALARRSRSRMRMRIKKKSRRRRRIKRRKSIRGGATPLASAGRIVGQVACSPPRV
jgi:hypothetical protein